MIPNNKTRKPVSGNPRSIVHLLSQFITSFQDPPYIYLIFRIILIYKMYITTCNILQVATLYYPMASKIIIVCLPARYINIDITVGIISIY
jgi:hypothetical protein